MTSISRGATPLNRQTLGDAYVLALEAYLACPEESALSGVAPREIEVTGVRLDPAPATPAQAQQPSLLPTRRTRGLLWTPFRRRDRRALADGGCDPELVHEATHAWEPQSQSARC